MVITTTTLTVILGILSFMGVIFSIFFYFKNPQIKTDQQTLKLNDDFAQLRKEVTEIKETHLRSVEQDLKSLTVSVNKLSETVAILSTIINERIPKASPNLTPPGM